jgi:hypothetical protein
MWRTKRQGGFGQAKWHLEQAIDEVDDRVAAVIENGEAPFWQVSARRSSARGGLTLGKGSHETQALPRHRRQRSPSAECAAEASKNGRSIRPASESKTGVRRMFHLKFPQPDGGYTARVKSSNERGETQ